jgi:hypothetical protein
MPTSRSLGFSVALASVAVLVACVGDDADPKANTPATTAADGGATGTGATGSCGGAAAKVSPDNHRYWTVASAATWDNAKTACESEGGHLAVLPTPSEDTFVRTSVEAKRWWIGLSDRLNEGDFVWVDGTPIGTARFDGNKGEPDGNPGGDADCVAFDGSPEMSWMDTECSDPGGVDGYLCECDP